MSKMKLKDHEECWVLFGKRGRWAWNAQYDRYTEGLPASVAFDPDYVYANEKNLIGFIHTHPHWSAYPSSTDHMTMKAWCDCLGRDLLCCIIGLDGLRAHWYLKDRDNPVEVSVVQIGRKIFGLNPKK